ncbi:MAG: hypothetical protein KA419_17825 [Acidobacteria bacterium]|nr:hypothetical protein [Acidobacteriota bacterium]
MTRTYVIFLKQTRPFTPEVIRRHVEHLRGLERDGRLALCGPFADGGGGMVAVRAGSTEEADHLARQDPFVAEGFETFEVRELIEANAANGYLLG